MKHPLVRLAGLIDCAEIERIFSVSCARKKQQGS